MTQAKERAREQAKKIAELNALFLTLNEKGQESALTILRSLEFAQSVTLSTGSGCRASGDCSL